MFKENKIGVYILEDKSKSIIKDDKEWIFVKIGMSETDINKRIKQVQATYKFTGNKSRLSTYVIIPCDKPRQVERWYHTYAKSFKYQNEFFLLPLDKLNEYIIKVQFEINRRKYYNL